MQTVGHTKRKIVSDRTLSILFFVVSLMEIGAEISKNTTAIYVIKPLIMPILALLYWQTSVQVNRLYLLGLFFCWISNIFFVKTEFSYIVAGACFFFVYRTINLYLILNFIKRPGAFPIFIGCIPFFFMFLYLTYIAYDIIQQGLWIFILQCMIMTLMGGISVGNHILQPSRGSLLLLMSSMLFALTQFVFVFKANYTTINFQPLAMALFVVGQYLFYRFIVHVETHKGDGQLVE